MHPDSFSVIRSGTARIVAALCIFCFLISKQAQGVVASADLSVVKTHESTLLIKDAIVTFTLVATNHGPHSASQVVVGDYIPTPSMTALAVESTHGSASIQDGDAIANIGSLAADESATVTVVTKINVSGPHMLVNTATVTRAETDPVWQNDSDADPLHVLPVCDLQLAKTVSSEVTTVGEQFAYTMTAVNLGPDWASGVQIIDSLPDGLELTTVTTSHLDIPVTTSGGVVQASFGSLSQNFPMWLKVYAKPTQPGTIHNIASVTGNVHDPDLSNNSSDVSTTSVLPPDLPDLTITMAKANRLMNARQKERVEGEFETKNIGTQPTRRAAMAKIYLRSPQYWIYPDELIQTMRVPRLKPGQTCVRHFSKRVADSAAGKRIYVVVDPDNEILEIRDDNNGKATSPLP